MASATIPETISSSTTITPAGKLTYAQLFARVKKGDIPNVSLGSVGKGIGMTREGEVAAGVRSLQENGYVSINETVAKLEDVLDVQEVRISVRLNVEVLPICPQDEWSVNSRRYQDSENQPAWDDIQVGRMVYSCRLSKFMDEYSLTIRARNGNAIRQRTLIDGAGYPTQRDAWEWVDEWITGLREMHRMGDPLPGSQNDDPHAAVVDALVEAGYPEEDAQRASEATIGEGDPGMRLEASRTWLTQNGIIPNDPDFAGPVSISDLAAEVADELEEEEPFDNDEEEPEGYVSTGDELWTKACRLAAILPRASVTVLKNRLECDHGQAVELMVRLGKAGVIEDTGRPSVKVLMCSEEVEAMLAREKEPAGAPA